MVVVPELVDRPDLPSELFDCHWPPPLPAKKPGGDDNKVASSVIEILWAAGEACASKLVAARDAVNAPAAPTSATVP